MRHGLAGRKLGVTEPVTVGAGPRVVLLDLGCKRSIPRRLAGMGLEVVVVPGDWDADAMLALEPAAVLIERWGRYPRLRASASVSGPNAANCSDATSSWIAFFTASSESARSRS